MCSAFFEADTATKASLGEINGGPWYLGELALGDSFATFDTHTIPIDNGGSFHIPRTSIELEVPSITLVPRDVEQGKEVFRTEFLHYIWISTDTSIGLSDKGPIEIVIDFEVVWR